MDKNKAKEASDLLSKIKRYESTLESLNHRPYDVYLIVWTSDDFKSECKLDNDVIIEINEVINKKINSLTEKLKNIDYE